MRLRTLLQLLLASLIVGFVLAQLDIQPTDLVVRVREAALQAVAFVRAAVDDLAGSAGDVVGYVLLGAVVVVPVWLLGLLLRTLRRRRD